LPVQSEGVWTPIRSVSRGGYQLCAHAVRARWLFVFLLAALAPAALQAEPREPAELRQAREHFRLGKEAYAAERFGDAFREFEAGYQLSNRPAFLLNMGHARRRSGALSEARALYRRFLLVQPDSPYRAEVEKMLADIDAAQPEPPPPPAPPKVMVVPPQVVMTPAAPPPALVRAAPPPAQPPPHHGRWWLWAGAGGAVVAAVVVAVLVRGGGDSYTREGSLGTLGAP